jgi:hypothetical protein
MTAAFAGKPDQPSCAQYGAEFRKMTLLQLLTYCATVCEWDLVDFQEILSCNGTLKTMLTTEHLPASALAASRFWLHLIVSDWALFAARWAAFLPRL